MSNENVDQAAEKAQQQTDAEAAIIGRALLQIEFAGDPVSDLLEVIENQLQVGAYAAQEMGGGCGGDRLAMSLMRIAALVQGVQGLLHHQRHHASAPEVAK